MLELLQHRDYKVRKEVAWAITNATTGGTAEQIMYIFNCGSIKPLCEFLSTNDARMITVALNGIENMLKTGEKVKDANNGVNPVALAIEQCDGLDKIEYLQSHENTDIYQKVFYIIETYFGGDEEDQNLAPEIQDDQFRFQQPNLGSGGQDYMFQHGDDRPFNF